MFQDYFAFLKIGNDWRAGIYSGLYPLPTVGLFTALSYIPWEIGYWGLAALGLFCVVIRLKRTAPAWSAYIPILQVILIGNLDVVWWGLWTTRLPIAYALLTLKPHLIPFALPEMIRWTRRQKLAWLGWTAALWLPCWLIRPGWFGEWIWTLSHFERLTQHWSSNLWNAPLWILIGGLISIPLLWWITKRRPSFRPMLLFLNPGINSYDYALLAGNAHWVIIPASWLAQFAERYRSAHWAWSLVGLLATLTTFSPVASSDRNKSGFVAFWKKVFPPTPLTAGDDPLPPEGNPPSAG
jgi:hypothetical protein